MTSTEYTSDTHCASTEAEYPDPVPISYTLCVGCTFSISIIYATIKGCEMVCSQSIRVALLANGVECAKDSRVTLRIAESMGGDIGYP